MMISDLPSDLIEEILSRVPAISLARRSQFTCKHWNALVKDPRFIKKHFDKAPKQSLLVAQMNDGMVHSMSFDLLLTCKLSLIHSHTNSKVYIYDVFHCDGLFLCTDMEDTLVVMNPCTGQTMWLKSTESFEWRDSYALGYANDKWCHNYKILKFTKDFTGRMDIYEICSNSSWRVCYDDFPREYFILSSGVSLKGNTYWLGFSKTGRFKGYLLLKFDFSAERFSRLSFPYLQILVSCDASLSVCRDEELSAFYWSVPDLTMEIWVSRKIETADVSWSNLLKVDFHYIPDLLDSYGAAFFMDYDKESCCFLF